MSRLLVLFEDDCGLALISVVRSLRGLVAFLAEQPSQLKHLEWPGFWNTVCHLHLEFMCRLGFFKCCI